MDDKFIFTEKILIIMLVVFSVFGTVIPLLFKQFNLALLGTYLCIPMISVSVIWFLIRNKNSTYLNLKENIYLLFILMFLLCCLFSILILYLYSVRTILYYILIAVMGVLIILQILYSENISRKQSVIILSQIILLFLNIIWGVTLKYYLFIGRTDGLFHSWVIENLIDKGYINKTFDIYEAFPLWHILCSFVYKIINMPVIPAKVMFIVNGFIYICLILVVYLAALKIFNAKIALLSSLFLCFNTDAVFYGMYSIPRSVIFFLEGLLIVLMIQQKTVINLSLCILIIMGLIMYHTASMPFIILILILLYLLQIIYSVKKPERFVNLNFILIILVLTVTYWMYAGVEVFNSVARSLFVEAPAGILTDSIVETPLEELFNYLQYSPLLLFVILGVLWGLKSSELERSSKIFLLTGLLLVPVSFPGPVLLLNKLSGNFNIARFGEYSFIFICIAGAAGIYILFGKLITKGRISVVFLFFMMAFLTVSNDFTASDNPLIKRPFYTYYLSGEECASFKSAAEIADGYLMSDYIYCRYMENSEYADKIHVLEADINRQEFLRSSDKDIIVIRTAELLRRPLKLFTSHSGSFILNPSVEESLDYYYNNLPVWDSLDRYNTVYDSGAVKLYR
ncbi:MAG: hypothetical protein ACYCWE_04450 [Eubacteriales bacterium]